MVTSSPPPGQSPRHPAPLAHLPGRPGCPGAPAGSPGSPAAGLPGLGGRARVPPLPGLRPRLLLVQREHGLRLFGLAARLLLPLPAGGGGGAGGRGLHPLHGEPGGGGAGALRPQPLLPGVRHADLPRRGRRLPRVLLPGHPGHPAPQHVNPPPPPPLLGPGCNGSGCRRGGPSIGGEEGVCPRARGTWTGWRYEGGEETSVLFYFDGEF